MEVGNKKQENVPLENVGEIVKDDFTLLIEPVQSVDDEVVEVQGNGTSEDLKQDGAVETEGFLTVGDETIARNEESLANDMMAGLSLDEAENAFRVKEKLDSISIIQELRFKPVNSSRLKIPLCRMIPLPLVRLLLHSDVRRLEAEFVHGYHEGDRVFYVSVSDDSGKSKLVTEELMGTWDRHWLHENEAFERQLSENIHLSCLSGHMFFIWDGNHRFQAWKNYISRLHSDEAEWHFSVDYILLTSKGSTSILLNAMNDVNKSTENAHVKTNLVHKLHRISSYGVLKLPDFKELLTTDEYKTYETQPKPYPWYPLTSDVFIKFLNRQDVSAAADEAARLYIEKTAEADRTARGIHDAMESASQARMKSYRTEFDKMISVANPKHGPKFLEAIYYHWSQYKKPEMSLEKLQKISTTIVEPQFKVKWLNWWNSGDLNRVALRFPAVGVTDDKLEAWLTKAAFWAQLEFVTVQAVNETMKSEEIMVDWKAKDDVDEIEGYIEKYRIILWDQAFYIFFRKSGEYVRSKPFLSQDGAKRAMQRLQYRYFKRELLGKKAIDKKSFPKLFGGWLERSLKDSYMFTPGQVRGFNSIEHTACPWYLECPKKFVPSEEEDEKALNASPTKPAEDSDADMSEDAPSKIEVKKTTKKGKETKGIKAPKKTTETVKSLLF